MTENAPDPTPTHASVRAAESTRASLRGGTERKVEAAWLALSDFAARHSAALATMADDPRDPAFADDWCDLVQFVATAYAALPHHDPALLPQGFSTRPGDDVEAEQDRSAEKAWVIIMLAKHRPDLWNWSCACGTMTPSDSRSHQIAHREHLADVLVRTDTIGDTNE